MWNSRFSSIIQSITHPFVLSAVPLVLNLMSCSRTGRELQPPKTSMQADVSAESAATMNITVEIGCCYKKTHENNSVQFILKGVKAPESTDGDLSATVWSGSRLRFKPVSIQPSDITLINDPSTTGKNGIVLSTEKLHDIQFTAKAAAGDEKVFLSVPGYRIEMAVKRDKRTDLDEGSEFNGSIRCASVCNEPI